MDYKELLIKYIKHVGECEGTTNINEDSQDLSLFTEREWEVLEELEQEAHRQGVKTWI